MMDDYDQPIEGMGDEDPNEMDPYEDEESGRPYVEPPPQKFRNNFRNNRYNNAYGDYAGGYGPPGGIYQRRNFRPQFGPPDDFNMPYGPPHMYPPGPYGPQFGPPRGQGNFMWGRGFGPGGPPTRKPKYEDKTIRYLKRCGVPKEHLKNLPRDLLQLIEPEYCGLCAMALDLPAASRMHYISKNHLKNQKKWLNQQTQIGTRRNNEIPLKARELYCELCDVHITSKAHSDSHYAGRQHRATVEGSRKPKNPILLQKGMECRVDQLIRREKKHLKTVPEEVVIEKDTKSTQPELYCEICKTSVTCSEQMTMHLNGKRHLSKEKQHILRMMKGESDKEKPDSSLQEESDKEKPDSSLQEDFLEKGDAESEEEGAGESEEGAKRGDAAEESYDWGNGEEKWDEAQKEEEWY